MNSELSLVFLAGTLLGPASGEVFNRVQCDPAASTIYGFSANSLESNTTISFSQYAGKVSQHSLLIIQINISGNCGSYIGWDSNMTLVSSHQVVLVYNVATYWGLTVASYTQINELANYYAGQDLVILGFPCNQFELVWYSISNTWKLDRTA